MARSNEEIAADIRTAASWSSGERGQFLAALAAEIDGTTPPPLTPNQEREQAAVAAEGQADDSTAPAVTIDATGKAKTV